MISHWEPDGREIRYDARKMTHWEERDTDTLECWQGPIERWDTLRLVERCHGVVWLDRNEASIFCALREEIKSRKRSAERRAESYRKMADGCDEVEGVVE